MFAAYQCYLCVEWERLCYVLLIRIINCSVWRHSRIIVSKFSSIVGNLFTVLSSPCSRSTCFLFLISFSLECSRCSSCLSPVRLNTLLHFQSILSALASFLYQRMLLSNFSLFLCNFSPLFSVIRGWWFQSTGIVFLRSVRWFLRKARQTVDGIERFQVGMYSFLLFSAGLLVICWHGLVINTFYHKFIF